MNAVINEVGRNHDTKQEVDWNRENTDRIMEATRSGIDARQCRKASDMRDETMARQIAPGVDDSGIESQKKPINPSFEPDFFVNPMLEHVTSILQDFGRIGERLRNRIPLVWTQTKPSQTSLDQRLLTIDR